MHLESNSVVIVRTVNQHDKEKEKLGELCYQTIGYTTIVDYPRHGSYIV